MMAMEYAIKECGAPKMMVWSNKDIDRAMRRTPNPTDTEVMQTKQVSQATYTSD